jgi:prolyl-tRNA synthetase
MNDEITKVPDHIARKSENFAEWYTDVVRKAELADYSPIRGCMIIRPYGYALWENVQRALDDMIKATGHSNMYFPLLIPESFLTKEADHVEGFAPEVAWVTHAGGGELEERLAIRPTSETIICSTYKNYIQSWRDLPVLVNQWANVVRWEMRTRFFLRTTEFLWQEGHTFHATSEEAAEETDKMLGVYRSLAEDWLAVPVIPGRKTDSEKFAGADYTISIEAMMSDGRALQSGTSHNLGQNFTRAYGIEFQTREQGVRQHPYQTSWGLSTRIIGAIIMTHGDESGLVLPPRVAPIQLVIVPIARKAEERTRVLAAVEEITAALQGKVRFKVDSREELTPGFKYNEWELKGVPLRMEIGPRDLDAGQAVLARRDTRTKQVCPITGLADAISTLLDEIQQSLFDRALELRNALTVRVDDYPTFIKEIESRNVFLEAHHCGERECEATIKADTKATVRCIPFAGPLEDGMCVRCNNPGIGKRVIFAKAY